MMILSCHFFSCVLIHEVFILSCSCIIHDGINDSCDTIVQHIIESFLELRCVHQILFVCSPKNLYITLDDDYFVPLILDGKKETLTGVNLSLR